MARSTKIPPPCPHCDSSRIKSVLSFWWPNSDKGRWEKATPWAIMEMTCYLLFFLVVVLALIPQILAGLHTDSLLLRLLALLMLPFESFAVYLVGKFIVWDLPRSPRKYQFVCRDCRYEWTMVRPGPKAELEMIAPVNFTPGEDPNLEHWEKEHDKAIANWLKNTRK
jgi:hypothetical protein